MTFSPRAWTRLQTHDDYDPQYLSPHDNTLDNVNGYLFFRGHRELAIDFKFATLCDALHEFLSRFSVSLDTCDIFSSQAEREEFAETYGLTGQSTIIPFDWDNLIEKMKKVNTSHRGTVWGEAQWHQVVVLKDYVSLDAYKLMSNSYISILSHQASQEGFDALWSPGMSIFGEKAHGFIDIVLLYAVFVLQRYRTVSPNGFPEMLIYNARATRGTLYRNPFVKNDNQPAWARPDDLFEYHGGRFFLWLNDIYKNNAYDWLADLQTRILISEKLVAHLRQKEVELAGNVQRVEFTNDYTWT